MSDSIGVITFRYPLVWLNKDEPVIGGQDTRTMSGDVITVIPAVVTQTREAELAFDWEPFATVTQMKTYARTGANVSAYFEGSSHTIRFQRVKDAVSDVKHSKYGDRHPRSSFSGKRTDIFDGKLKVFIIS